MEVMPGGTSGWQQAGSGLPTYFAAYLPSISSVAVAQPLGVALAVLGQLDDCLGDRARQRVSAINQSKPDQRGLEGRGQVGNVFWTKRAVVFENRPDRHVQHFNHAPHVTCNTSTSAVCAIGDSSEDNQQKSMGTEGSELGHLPYLGHNKNPAEWPWRGPEIRSHSGRGDAAAGPAIPIRSRVLGSVRECVFI
jgi:hypothetical protein